MLQEEARQQWGEEKAQMLQDSERWCGEQVAEMQSKAQEELLAVQAEAESMWVPAAGFVRREEPKHRVGLYSCTRPASPCHARLLLFAQDFRLGGKQWPHAAA